MPSFDIVSEIDLQEVKNALENMEREVISRWDFRGTYTESKFVFPYSEILLKTESAFQINQLIDIFKEKILKRNLPANMFDFSQIPQASGKTFLLAVAVKKGLSTDLARKIVNRLKEKKLRVQTQVQGEQVRVSGKTRDELQVSISEIRLLELPQAIQFVNFRS